MKYIAVNAAVVGDSGAGKSRLLVAYSYGVHTANNVHPAMSCYVHDRVVDHHAVSLRLFDTSSGPNPNYDGLRISAYSHTDVIFICFSLVDPESYESVRTKWYPEISRHAPRAKILLIGTKVDLRDDLEVVEDLENRNLKPVTYQQGLAMCRDISAAGYFECSACTGEGLGVVFEEGMRIAGASSRSSVGKRRSCIVF
ncbi:P-loop containing nucleoside triphosphate hydrolase protein [Gymnopilus junonius]|uniref:P-loop containing nucleoside triphosphate hydrolase protein n=1 Tax=Gymnopilus junonius TaxID=109634 RepID=A0A9P5NKT4_GYMJU|nr:P-loop containing nucleoside triphosphate hydrolase protein [Gymnopilus junonius]